MKQKELREKARKVIAEALTRKPGGFGYDDRVKLAVEILRLPEYVEDAVKGAR